MARKPPVLPVRTPPLWGYDLPHGDLASQVQGLWSVAEQHQRCRPAEDARCCGPGPQGEGGRKNNQRPGPPGTHLATIPGPDSGVNAPAETRSGTALRPISRWLLQALFPLLPAARCDRTGSSTTAWSGVCAMRGREHGHGVSRLARAASPRSASRRAARSHRVRWPARRTSGRAASDRPAAAASRWQSRVRCSW